MNKYKKTMTLLASFVFAGLQAFSQNSPVDKFFNQYANDDRFTLVSIGPQMMSMIDDNKHDILGKTYIKKVDNLKSLRILTTETTPQQFYKEAVSALDVPPFEEMMTVRDKGQNIKFLARKENGKIVQTIMIAGEKDEFTLMCIEGDVIDLINSNLKNEQ